jgi:hypothetical protein
VSLFYKFQYLVGMIPWERMATLPSGDQAIALLGREEGGREPPYGRALDLGCGNGGLVSSPGAARVGSDRRSTSCGRRCVFEVREPLVAMQGPPLPLHVPGCTVRRATKDDVDECNALCVRVHGHDRRLELVEAIGADFRWCLEHGSVSCSP